MHSLICEEEDIWGARALHQMPLGVAQMLQAMNLAGPHHVEEHHWLGLAMITEALANLRSTPKAAATLSEGN